MGPLLSDALGNGSGIVDEQVPLSGVFWNEREEQVAS